MTPSATRENKVFRPWPALSATRCLQPRSDGSNLYPCPTMGSPKPQSNEVQARVLAKAAGFCPNPCQIAHDIESPTEAKAICRQ